MAKIFVLGDFNIDLVLYLDRLPRAGETLNANSFFEGPGGKGSNQAIAAARLGADVTFFGAIGKDYYGEVALRAWQENGVNIDDVQQSDEYQTAMALINVDAEGNNTITVHQGANLRLTSAHVESVADAIREADIVMSTLGVDPNIVQQVFKIAKDAHCTTILNPAPATEISPELLQASDYITPNESELGIIAPKEIKSANDTHAAKMLLVRDDQTIVTTLGADGARWVTKTDSKQIATFNVDVVDTVGAGDAFNAAFAVALSEGQELDDAIRFANAAAALSVQKIGAVDGMPMRDDVMALLTSSL